MHHEIFSNILGLCPLDDSSNLPPQLFFSKASKTIIELIVVRSDPSKLMSLDALDSLSPYSESIQNDFSINGIINALRKESGRVSLGGTPGMFKSCSNSTYAV